MIQNKNKQLRVELSERIEKQLSVFSETYGISREEVMHKSLICYMSAFDD